MTTATASIRSNVFDRTISDAKVKYDVDAVTGEKTKPARPIPDVIKKLDRLKNYRMSRAQKELLLSCVKGAVVLAAVALSFRD